MICPLRLAGFGGLTNFDEEPFGCQKEKCAWWVEQKDGVQREVPLKGYGNCAIRLMAERGK